MRIFKITRRTIEKMKERKDVRGLIKALKSKEPEIRKLSASALGLYDIRDAIAVLPLIPLLKDEDLETRKETADTLGYIGDARAVGPLIEALEDIEPGMRENAAYALGFIGDTQALEQLIETLTDVESGVRYSALSALGNLGDKKAIEPLIPMLHDQDSEIRIEAARILGEMKDPRAAEPLFNALGDDDVCYFAATALGTIEDEGALDFLCRALLKDFSSELQLRIATTLVKTGDEKAIEPLIQYLKDKDEETHRAILKQFSFVTHREDWKGKKNRMFDSVYKVIANRLNFPVDKEPEETIYEGRNVDEVIESICTVAIPQTQILTQSQINAEYAPIQEPWGTALHKGTVEDLVKALRPRLTNDLADREFSGFSVIIYHTHRCSQVESYFEATFKGYRIWCTDKQLFSCFSME